jgi:predicted house-cleaning noncanonical NTP pyrophosphatase (MazG superfamily)
MKNKIPFTKIVSKLRKHSVSLRDQQLMHPEREWVIGLVGATLLFLLVTSVSVYAYFKNQSVDIKIPIDETTKTVYRESVVDEVLTILEKRRNILEELNQEDLPKEMEVVSEIATSTEDVGEVLETVATTSPE